MKYYNAKEAAEYLGKSERTIRRWIKSGHIEAKRRGNRFLIYESDLDVLTGYENGQADKDLSDTIGQITDIKRTSGQSDDLSNVTQITDKLQDILEVIERSQDKAIVTYNENPLVEELRQERDSFREENAKLWNLLGQAQQANKQLEGRVKMLEGHKEDGEKKQKQGIEQLATQKEAEKRRALAQLWKKADEIVQRSKQEVTETREKIVQKEREIKRLQEFLEEEQSRGWWDRLWKK